MLISIKYQFICKVKLIFRHDLCVSFVYEKELLCVL